MYEQVDEWVDGYHIKERKEEEKALTKNGRVEGKRKDRNYKKRCNEKWRTKTKPLLT